MEYQKAIVVVAYNPIEREKYNNFNNVVVAYNPIEREKYNNFNNIYIKRAWFLLTCNVHRNLANLFQSNFVILMPTYLVYNKNFIIQLQ